MTGRWSCQAEAAAVAAMATVQCVEPQLSERDRGLNSQSYSCFCARQLVCRSVGCQDNLLTIFKHS